MKSKPQTVNTASLLFLVKDDKTLLMRRAEGPFKGFYTFVSGKVDVGETFTEAIIREVKEEANLDLKAKDLKVAHIIHQPDIDNEYIHTYFIANKWGGELKNMEPEKCDDIGWFDLDNLPENTIPLVLKAIENINKNVFYSELRWDTKTLNK